MKRRVIKQGNNTLTITLPKKWAEKHSLKAGEEIDVEEETGKLIVDPRKEQITKFAAFQITSHNAEYIHQVLRNLYNSDIEELELSYSDPEVLGTIQKYAPRFLGWEFLEQNDKRCRIRNYAFFNEENFQELYRKSFISIANMIEAIQNDIQQKRRPSTSKIACMNDTTFRFANYCRKMLMKKSIFPVVQTRAHSHLLTNLIIISSNCSFLVQYMEKKDLSALPPPLWQYLGKVVNLYRKMQTIFLQKSIKDISAFAAMGRELQDEGINLLERTKGVDTVMLYYLITITTCIKQQGGRLMVVAEKY